MSRSRRHTPIAGITTADSEARDKALHHRRRRRVARHHIARGDEDIPDLRGNPCEWAKDGRRWYGTPDCAWFRPKLMRK